MTGLPIDHMPAIITALAVADADLRDRHHETAHQPWYISPNLVTDHLYATCPGLRRALPPGQQPVTAPGVIYPQAGDICGWCHRVWAARTTKENQ